MSKFKKIIDEIKGNEDFSEVKSIRLRDIFTGRILTKKFVRKQFFLIVLVAFCTFFYVDNRFYCEKQLAKEAKLKKEIRDLKYESLTISADLMRIGRQSHILKKINEKGIPLKENKTPPIVVE